MQNVHGEFHQDMHFAADVVLLIEARVGVFDQAIATLRLDSPVRVHRNMTLLNIQLLQAPAPLCHLHDPRVCNGVTSLDTQLAQVRGVFGKCVQRVISDVSFSDVERPQARTVSRYALDSTVRHSLTTADVEVAQFVTLPGNGLDTDVGHLQTLDNAQVAEVGAELAEFAQSEVGHTRALAQADLLQIRAVVGDVLHANVGDARTASEVEVGEFRAVRGDDLEADVVELWTVAHVDAAQVELFAVRLRLHCCLRSQTDTGNVQTT